MNNLKKKSASKKVRYILRANFITIILFLISSYYVFPVKNQNAMRVKEILNRYKDSVVAVKFIFKGNRRGDDDKEFSIPMLRCGICYEPGKVVFPAAALTSPLVAEFIEVSSPEDLKVIDSEGKEWEGTLEKTDSKHLTAILTTKAPLKPVSLKDGCDPEVGDEIMLLGFMSEVHKYQSTFYTATISAKLGNPFPLYDFTGIPELKTTGLLAVGTDGCIKGMIGEQYFTRASLGGDDDEETASALAGRKFLSSQSEEAFIFPPSEIEKSISEATKVTAAVKERPWMGVIVQALGHDLADYWKIPNFEGGVVLSAVIPYSPASKAGLLVGDCILAIDDKPIAVASRGEEYRFTNLLELIGIGKTIKLRVYRTSPIEKKDKSGLLDIPLTLETFPLLSHLAEPFKDETIGATFKEITVDIIEDLNLEEGALGVYVANLKRSYPAQLGGLRIFDVIIKCNGKDIKGMEDIKIALKESEDKKQEVILFLVKRGQDTSFISVRIAQKGNPENSIEKRK